MKPWERWRVRRFLRKRESELRARSNVRWQDRTAAVVLIGRQGVVLCEHRKSPARWDNELAKRFVAVVARVETSFASRSPEELAALEFGDVRVTVVHGKSVMLLVELTGEMPPEEVARLRGLVAGLEHRYGADLSTAKEKESLPALEGELTDLLRLGW